jgi:hypothetical protein
LGCGPGSLAPHRQNQRRVVLGCWRLSMWRGGTGACRPGPVLLSVLPEGVMQLLVRRQGRSLNACMAGYDACMQAGHPYSGGLRSIYAVLAPGMISRQSCRDRALAVPLTAARPPPPRCRHTMQAERSRSDRRGAGACGSRGAQHRKGACVLAKAQFVELPPRI